MRYFRVIFFALFGISFFSWCFTFACNYYSVLSQVDRSWSYWISRADQRSAVCGSRV